MVTPEESIIVERYFTRGLGGGTSGMRPSPLPDPEVEEFLVVQAVNTLLPHVGRTLSRDELQACIDQGVKVTIRPSK